MAPAFSTSRRIDDSMVSRPSVSDVNGEELAVMFHIEHCHNLRLTVIDEHEVELHVSFFGDALHALDRVGAAERFLPRSSELAWMY